MKKLSLALCAALSAMSAGVPALADPVTWTIQNATVSDGSTVSGSFVFDADAPSGTQFSNINIVTTTVGGNTGRTYSIDGYSANRADFFLFKSGTAGSRYRWYAYLPQAMTNAGGTRNLVGGSEGACNPGPEGASECGGGVDYRNFSAQIVANLPVITSLSAQSGPTSGGNSVTITGSNLGSAAAVTFGVTPASITANTATSITVTVPAEVEGTVDVRVTTTAGISANTSADDYTYNLPPEPVPTMTEWAMILFSTILAGGAALHLQRRRRLV
ncbi:IPTL-CTERM sorting domain-containing protein [Brevundimonas sp.]